MRYLVTSLRRCETYIEADDLELAGLNAKLVCSVDGVILQKVEPAPLPDELPPMSVLEYFPNQLEH